jgi:hypothetical protein
MYIPQYLLLGKESCVEWLSKGEQNELYGFHEQGQAMGQPIRAVDDEAFLHAFL